MEFKHYSILASLFDYPLLELYHKVPQILALLDGMCPSAAAEARIFCDQLLKNDLDRMQELYTRSFDIQAITTLDVGYVLFGDDYKRGAVLSQLSREHQNAHNDCGTELADHLPNLLRLIGKSLDNEFIQDLARDILAPALKKMIDEFDPEKLDQKNKFYRKHYKTLIETSGDMTAIYQHALKALFIVIKQDFQINEESLCQHDGHKDSLDPLNSEMLLEKTMNE